MLISLAILRIGDLPNHQSTRPKPHWEVRQIRANLASSKTVLQRAKIGRSFTYRMITGGLPVIRNPSKADELLRLQFRTDEPVL